MNKNTLPSEVASVRDPRHLRFRAISTALTVVVIVGIVLLNIFFDAMAQRYPLTIDMSSDKVFTLSADSKSFAKSVENKVEVVVLTDPEEYFLALADQLYSYYQVNLSNQFERISREVETALAQLKSTSDGKISYTFISPDQEPEKYAKYSEYNLGENNILFISGERYKKAMLDTMIEVVDENTVYSNVEKVLVSNIFALQGESDRIIQVLTGHDEDIATIAGLKRLYELNGYTFEELDITGSTEFSAGAEVLLIAAPKNDYTKEEIRRITEWLENDKKRNHHLMVFVDPDLPVSGCPNLYGLLKENYHIEVTDQKIYESDNDRYFSDGTAYNQSWVWADVPNNKYTTAAYGDQVVKAPASRRLLCDLPSSPSGNGIEEWGLQLTTHPDSARVSIVGGNDEKKELKSDEYPLVSGVSYVYEATDNNELKAATTTVTVFGSSAMAYGMFLQDYSTNNEELLLGIIHSVTNYQTGIIVSNKVVAKDVTQFKASTQMTLGIWVFTVGLPAVVLIVCLVVFLRRRSL